MSYKQSFAKITLRGTEGFHLALKYERELKAQGYVYKQDWNWNYYPSQHDEHRRAEFWVRDPALLSWLALKIT